MPPRRSRRGIGWLPLLLGAALLSGLLSGCAETGGSFMHPHGLVAAAQRRWLLDIVLLMAIVVVPIFVMMPWFAWRYRRRSTRSAYTPNWEFSWPIEFLVWGAPAIIVALLAILIIEQQTPLDPYRNLPGDKTPLQVDVVALDWKFLFIYPDQHVASVSLLAIPQDRPVEFHLTSDATMQSFFIPALGSQIYAMAGMVTRLHLIADSPATLTGENTQFNGMHFQDDKFTVSVLSPTEFDHWITARQADNRPLDQAAYRTLSQRTTTTQAKAGFQVPDGGVLGFSDVPANLFASIVDKYHAGDAPMPMHAPAPASPNPTSAR